MNKIHYPFAILDLFKSFFDTLPEKRQENENKLKATVNLRSAVIKKNDVFQIISQLSEFYLVIYNIYK